MLLLSACAFVATACKKDHDCVCTNSNGSYTAGTIKDTRMRAKKQCENLSTGDTKCTIN